MSEKRERKKRNTWAEIGRGIGIFIAGIGLPFCLAFLMRRLPDMAAILIASVYFLASVPLLAWAIKRGKGSLEIFALMSIIFGAALFGGISRNVTDNMTFYGFPWVFLVIAVAVGLLGGGICLWIIDLEWRYSRSKERRSVLAALLEAAVIAFASFGFGMGILDCANLLLDHASPRQTTATVEELQREYCIGGRYRSGYYTYYVTVSGNELTGESARLSVDEQRYEALAVGDEVLVLLHPGALGQAWLECVLGEE